MRRAGPRAPEVCRAGGGPTRLRAARPAGRGRAGRLAPPGVAELVAAPVPAESRSRRQRRRQRRRRGRHRRRRGRAAGRAAAVGRAAAAARPVAASRLAAGPRRCRRRRSLVASSTARTIPVRPATRPRTRTTRSSTTSPCHPTVSIWRRRAATAPAARTRPTPRTTGCGSGDSSATRPRCAGRSTSRIRGWDRRTWRSRPTDSTSRSRGGRTTSTSTASPASRWWDRSSARIGPLYGVGFSPDSQTVFSIDYDSTLADGTLYADRVNGDPVALAQLGVDPDVLAVSPVAGTGNTSTIAVGGYDGTAGVYVFNGTTIPGRRSDHRTVRKGVGGPLHSRGQPAGDRDGRGVRPLLERPAGVDDADRESDRRGRLDGHGAVVLAAGNVRGRCVRLRDGHLQLSTRAFVSRASAAMHRPRSPSPRLGRRCIAGAGPPRTRSARTDGRSVVGRDNIAYLPFAGRWRGRASPRQSVLPQSVLCVRRRPNEEGHWRACPEVRV